MSSSTIEVTPIAALAVAVFAASTSAILVRWSTAPSAVAAFYRVVFTTALVVPIALVGHREAFARLSRRDFGFAVVAGVALAVHFAAWFESLNHTSVAASVTLVQTQPIFVALGAALVLGERVGRGTIAGIAVAIVGATAMSFGGAITLCLLVGTQGHAYLDYPAREWLLFLGMAVGPGLLGHTISNWALKHLESVVVSVGWLGEPIGVTEILDRIATDTTRTFIFSRQPYRV